MKTKIRAVGIGATTALVAGLFATFGTGAASAAPPVPSLADGPEQCVVDLSKIELIHHDAVYESLPKITEGKDEESHQEMRWMRQIPAVDAVTHDETQYSRTIPGSEEQSHEQWMYSMLVPGDEEVTETYYRFSRENPGRQEISHPEYQFSRMNPGRQEVSHQEQQFSREIPGQQEISHQEHQFSRVNPGKQEVSHQEYKYSKSVTQFRYQTRVHRPDNKVERKFVKGYAFVDGGETNVGGTKVSGHWVQSAGWHQLPDSITNVVWGTGGIPANLLGGSESNPKGNVNLNVYGGPSVSVPYYASEVTIDGGYTAWGPWSGWSTTDPGPDTSTRQAQSQVVTTLYNDGAWTKDSPGAPWTKIDERKVVTQDAVPPFTEYRKPNGDPTTSQDAAGWFTETSFTGWTQFGDSKKVVTQEAIAPFTEYRKENGDPSISQAEAAWFTETSFAGWNQFGESKTVVTEAAIAPFTEYRMENGDPSISEADAAWFPESTFTGWNQFGDSQTLVTVDATDDVTYFLVQGPARAFTSSTDPDDATWFTSSDGVGPEWTEFNRERVVDQAAIPPLLVYLTQDDEGEFGETEDPELASWIPLNSDNGVDLETWQRVLDSETGLPVVRTVTDMAEIPGYNEYYVPGGDPTLELGDTNWTVDSPEGWTKVDERKIVTAEQIPPTTTITQVLVKKAWDEKKIIPTSYTNCLPKTGSDSSVPLSITAASLFILGAGALTLRLRRKTITA